MKRKSVLFALIAVCAAFLLFHTMIAILPNVWGEGLRTVSDAVRLFIVAGILGIIVPIAWARKADLPYDRPSNATRITAGITLSTAAVGLEIVFFSSWFIILTENPDDAIRLKHMMATLPISIALSLLFYFIVPESFEQILGLKPVARILSLVVPAGALGLALYAETGFSRTDVLFVMTGVGFLAAAGHLLTDKFFLTFVTIFLAVYANSLAELRYASLSWPIAITGFIFCLFLLVAGFFIHVSGPGTEPGETEAAT